MLLLGACGSAAPVSSRGATVTQSVATSAPASAAISKPAAKTATWSAGDPAGDQVKISYASPALSGLPLYAALSEDFFSRRHVKVQMLKMPSTPAIAALSKGEIDMVNQPALAIQGASRGLPFKILMGWWREAPWTLIGKPALKSLQDLKGKNVATTAVGNSPYLYLEASLRKVGLDIKNDVNVVSSRGTEDSYAFLLAGDVDAAVVSPPFPSQAETQGFHTVAALGSALQIPYTGLAATSGYINQHGSTVVGVIAACLDATRWLNVHPDRAAKLAELYVGVEPAIAQKATDEMLPLLSKTFEETPQGIQQALDAQARVTKTPIELKPEELVDYRPLHEAIKQG